MQVNATSSSFIRPQHLAAAANSNGMKQRAIEQRATAMAQGSAMSDSARSLADVTSTPGAPATGSNEPLTIEGLMEAWGEKGSRYDLNADGTVNMSDLLELMSRIQPDTADPMADPMMTPTPSNTRKVDETPGMPAEPATVAANPDPADAPIVEPPSVDGLMEAWGEKDSQYDLDGDGTVGMSDLLIMLGQLSRDQQHQAPPVAPEEATKSAAGFASVDNAPAPSVAGEAPMEPEAVPAPPMAPMSVDGLMEAWGSDSQQYDFNQDGTVDMSDLMTLLSKLSGQHGPMPQGLALGANEEMGLGLGLGDSRVESLAARLRAGLSTVGYDQAPPSNLHSIVGELGLAPQDSRAMLDRLMATYPGGLGLDLRG